MTAAYGEREGPPAGGEPDEALAALASEQHGVVSAAQLAALGFTSHAIYRRLRRHRLIRLHVGVYAVGHIALTVRSRRLAAVLACGPGALLSHRSAADLWRLVPAGSARIEVAAPRGRKPREGILVHRSRVIHPEDVATVEAIPVTSVSRTLVDFADVADEPRVERAVNEAELRGLFDLRAVERAIERLPNRVGRGRLRRALEAFYPEPAFTRSEGERRFIRVCRDHGLPPPSANLWVAGHEVDLIWPDAGIVVEIDGAATHRTTLAFHRDRRRDRELAAHGLQVVRLTGRDLSDPTALAADMRAVRACRLQEPGRVRATPRAP